MRGRVKASQSFALVDTNLPRPDRAGNRSRSEGLFDGSLGQVVWNRTSADTWRAYVSGKCAALIKLSYFKVIAIVASLTCCLGCGTKVF